MRNSRGLIGTLTIMLVVAIFAISLLVAFFVSKNFRIMTIGLGLLVGGFVMLAKVINSKKKPSRQITGILFLIFGFGLILALVPIFGVFSNTALGGSTVLSISDVDLVDGGSRIRIFGTATGAENIAIDFNKEELTERLKDEGFEATKTVTGNIRLTSQNKEFKIQKNFDTNFYEYRLETFGRLDPESTCGKNVPKGYIYDGVADRSATNVLVCAYKKSLGSDATFSGQTVLDSVVTFDIGGAKGTLEPRRGSNTITLNDGKTKVEWTGDLSNFNQVSEPNLDILFHESVFQRLIDTDASSNAQREEENLLECIRDDQFNNDVKDKEKCVNEYNNKLNTILRDRTIDYQLSISDKIKGVTFSDDSFIVKLNSADSFPTFIITLDASKVGIRELKGDPQITSCLNDQEFDSGDSVSPTIKVKNVGNSGGSFFGSVSCSGTASVNGIIEEVFVEGGETVTMPVRLSGSNTEDGTKVTTCTYTIKDRKSGRTDSCKSEVSVSYQSGLVCNPGKTECVGADTKRTCSSDGLSFTDTECGDGCTYNDDDEAICKSPGEQTTNEVEGSSGDLQPSDCRFYESFVERDEENKRWWNYLGIGTPETVTIRECTTANWVYIVAGSLIVLIVLVVGMIIIFGGKKRKKKR